MDLNVPAPAPAPASTSTQESRARGGGKGLPDQPPKAWAGALREKYGAMPVSDNARTVLERGT